MAKQTINIGTSANDGTGDPLRTAMDKTNDNFTELYNGAGGVADGAVTTAKLAADAVDGTKISDDSVNSEHYVDGSIDTVHIADDQITVDKLADEFTEAQAVSSATTIALDGGSYDVFTWTAGHSTTVSFSNITLGMTKTLQITGGGGSYTLAFGNINGYAGTFNKVSGDFDDTSSTKNLIQIKFISTTEAWYAISQIAS